MEKLLKHVYQLYRKETKGLKEELKSLKQNVKPRYGYECERCVELQKELRRLTVAYEKLLSEKLNDSSSESENRKPSTESELNSNLDDSEDLYTSESKTTSVFDEKSPMSLNTFQEERFSPVPETPDAFKTNYMDLSPVVILETMDDCIPPPNLIKNASHQSTSNRSLTRPNLTIQIPPINTNKATGATSPEVKILSPVSSNKKPENISDDLTDDDLTDFEIPRMLKRRRKESKISHTSKLTRPSAKTINWKPSVPSKSSANYFFEPAPSGYKKPKYKQTTLSQVMGEMRRPNSKHGGTDSVKKNLSSEEDLDATYVPSQCLPRQPTGSHKTKSVNDKHNNEEVLAVCESDESEDSSRSEDLLSKMASNDSSSKNTSYRPSTSNNLPSSFFDDFDEFVHCVY
ncbi:DNA endonuclease rbbp8, variant 2 [Chamberlinius hualienensis]